MPYITREDGERFIIPSYRDVLSAKRKSLLKREITLLSSNYGEYIALQRKSSSQYEVAFSTEPGALLGETIWHYFKRPRDLIYCESIPDTTEAILVIVKSGSVYLDGAFPLDSIPEELVIFQTQQSQFEIYIYGDVPLSETPEAGKFALDSSSIKSFKRLDKPVFPTLPLVKSFQLQLVDVVLKQHGIGVFPLKPLLTVIIVIGLGWMAWTYVTTHRKEIPSAIIGVVNPYQLYFNTLTAPNPTDEIRKFSDRVLLLFSMPGWTPDSVEYSKEEGARALVKSNGARVDTLTVWAKMNKANVSILPAGIYVILNWKSYNRLPPSTINELDSVLAALIDRLSYVLPGDHLTLGTYTDRGRYTEVDVTISFQDITPATFTLIGVQFEQLPIVLSKVNIDVKNGNLTGSIVLKVLGN